MPNCKLTWGVDGYGYRHYMCDDCQIYMGVLTNAQEQDIQSLIDSGVKCSQFGSPIQYKGQEHGKM